MKKIGIKVFSHQRNSINNENIENNEVLLKEKNKNNYVNSPEDIQESKQKQIISEKENNIPKRISSIPNNNIIIKNQPQEQNLEFGIIQCSSNQGVFSPFELSANDIDSKYKTWISSK